MKRSAFFVLGVTLSSLIMSSNVMAKDDDDDHDDRKQSRYERHYENHGYHQDHATYAKVLHADPLIAVSRRPYTQQQCWDERVSSPSQGGRTRHNAAGAMILGGILGGVVGHQIDRHGNGDTAKLIGTLVGASIGHDMGNNDIQPVITTVSQRCSNITRYDNDERIVGYRVTYRYRGQTFVTRTDHHPGSRIRVNVAVTPDH